MLRKELVKPFINSTIMVVAANQQKSFGHQFHHLLKDKNVEEIKIRNRVSDVIPLFYELMCADDEDNKLVAKEIIKRRIFLLQLEKSKRDDIDTLQLFNSYYYALGLFLKYKKDDLIVLRLISRVLMGEITTLELLTMLNLYEEDLDYEVSRQLETIKQNILRQYVFFICVIGIILYFLHIII